MKYIRFTGSAGYAGTDYEEYVAFPDDVTEEEIDEYSYEQAAENAETFEYVVRGLGEWEDEDDRTTYYDNAMNYCYWEEVTKEEYEENE